MKKFIENFKELKVIDLIKLIPLSCVALSFFIAFIGIMVLVCELTTTNYPSLSGQILWTIIWGIASFKIAFSLEKNKD